MVFVVMLGVIILNVIMLTVKIVRLGFLLATQNASLKSSAER
jgi:hypothetical protein